MKTKMKTAEGANYAAVTVGKMNELSEHTFVFAPGIEIPGKVFVGEMLAATGAEISFQSFAPNAETGFLHMHKTHEELYLVIAGDGEFQVDGNVFPIAEGTVVRVAPEGSRAIRNTGSNTLIVICIQYKAASFNAEDSLDGVILGGGVPW